MNDNCQDVECLAGIRVVDFTQFEAGPSCTEALAWLGAEVVKIENPKTGDPARRVLPGKAPDDPWYFHMFNANKKSLTLDLKSPRGLELVKKLLTKADVTVECLEGAVTFVAAAEAEDHREVVAAGEQELTS